MKKATLENLHGERVAATKNRLRINEQVLREKMMEMFFGEVADMSYTERMKLCTQIMTFKKREIGSPLAASEGQVIKP